MTLSRILQSKYLRRDTIFFKMMAALMVVGTLPLIVFGYFAISGQALQIKEHNRGIHKSLLDTVKSSLIEHVTRAEYSLTGAAKHEALRAANYFLLKESMTHIRLLTPGISRLSFLDKDWNVVSSDPPTPEEDGKKFTVPLRLRSDNLLASPIYADTSRTSVYFYLAKTLLGLDESPSGHILAVIDLTDWITTSRHLTKDFPSVTGALIQPGQKPVFFTAENGQERAAFTEEILERIAASPLNSDLSDQLNYQEKIGTDSHFVSVSKLPNLEGVIFVTQPASILFAPNRKFVAVYVAFLLALIIAVTYVLMRFTRGIAGPLMEISQVAESYQQGDFTRRLRLTRDDEIGTLAIAFNQMGASLEEKTRIGAEIALAASVQKGLARKSLRTNPRLRFETYYKPAMRLGGDWYALFEVEKADSVFVLIGDVTGHGLAQGLIVSAVQGALSTIESLMNDPAKNVDLKPSEIMAVLDDVVRSTTVENSLLMTAIVAKYDFKMGEVVVSNAGHPFPALIRQTSGSNHLQNLLATPQGLVGYVHPITEKPRFKDERFALQDLDLMVFFTDGLTNARDGGDRLFNRTLFREFRSLRGYHSPGSLKKNILDLLKVHTRDMEQNDDICFLVVEYRQENGALLSRSG